MRKKKSQRFLLLVAAVLFCGLLYCVIGPFYYDHQTEANYWNNRSEFFAMQTLVKDKSFLEQSFRNYPLIDLFTTIHSDSADSFVRLIGVSLDDKRFIGAISASGWSLDDVLKLKKLLDAVNCISITNRGPVIPRDTKYGDRSIEVCFRDNILGRWVYLLFPKSLSQEQMEIKLTDFKKIKRLDSSTGWSKSYMF